MVPRKNSEIKERVLPAAGIPLRLRKTAAEFRDDG